MTAEHRGRVIEVVITSRTRNAVVRKGTWVRIPHSPPSKNPVTMRVSGFFFFLPTPTIAFFSAVLSIVLERTALLFIPCIFLLLSPTCCRNPRSLAMPFRLPLPAPRTAWNCNQGGRRYSPWWKNHCAPASLEFVSAVRRLQEEVKHNYALTV